LYTTQPTSATVRLGAPDGPIVAKVGVDFPIEPTKAMTLTAWLPPELVGTGQHLLYWELDPGMQLRERDRSDNTALATVGILPDLSSNAVLLGWNRAARTAAPVLLRVENNGSAASAATAAEVWSGDQKLTRVPIAALAPGEAVDIEGVLPASTAGYEKLTVRIDPDNVVAETNENNNLVIGGGLATALPPPGGGTNRMFIPLVKR
jgi:hypothetical protein